MFSLQRYNSFIDIPIESVNVDHIFDFQSVLQRKDEGLIKNTIRKLPLSFIVPLVQELAKRMHSHAQR